MENADKISKIKKYLTFEVFRNIVAVLFMFVVVPYLFMEISNKQQVSNQHLMQKESIKSSLIGIRQEIWSLREILGKGLENTLELSAIDNSKDFYNFKAVYSQDYFIIYQSNSIYLGQVENKKLINSVIDTYVWAKFIIDIINSNSKILDEYENLLLEQERNRENGYDSVIIKERIKRLEVQLLINKKSLSDKYKRLIEKSSLAIDLLDIEIKKAK